MNQDKLQNVAGVLCDLDGVVWLDDTPYPRAAETIRHLKETLGLPCRFVTNTTTRSLDSLYQKAVRLEMPIEKSELITPPRLAARYLKEQKARSVFLVMEQSTRDDFADFPHEDISPDWVVIGNYNESWNYQIINRIFQMLLDGARLLALHKQRFWQTGVGLKVDIGCFVRGLEYSAGVTAVTIGKPEPLFFQTALNEMGVKAEQAIMVGDDINSDIGGAQNAGLRGVLVKTGKYREHLVAEAGVTPDRTIDALADVVGLLG